MINDYTRYAHRRAIWGELQRYLREQYVAGEEPPKKELICEEVFFAEKEVTQEAFFEVMEELQRLEGEERINMTQYEFRRRDVKKLQQKGGQSTAEEAARGEVEAAGEPERKPVGPVGSGPPAGAGV